MLSAVLDANVLVAGLSSRRGASHQVLRALDRGLFQSVITAAVFLEYEEVLSRPEIRARHGLRDQEIERFLDGLAVLSRRVEEIWFHWRPLLPDPGDEKLVECAVAGEADYLVTFNQRHFAPVRGLFGFQAVQPREFLDVL